MIKRFLYDLSKLTARMEDEVDFTDFFQPGFSPSFFVIIKII